MFFNSMQTRSVEPAGPFDVEAYSCCYFMQHILACTMSLAGRHQA